MRHFPKNTDLSDEQKIIYSEHLDKALLITGPPGTGKTVMAIMRAKRMGEEMESKNAKVPLLMKNNTLYEFTENQTGRDKAIEVKTLEKYLLHKSGLRSERNGREYKFPWATLLRTIRAKNPQEIVQLNLFPKFLILDEGQDFPNTLWKIISDIWMKMKSIDKNFVPSIMADENQSLDVEQNSSIQDIRDGLSTTKCFNSFKEAKLTRNYRNTREIAAFAEKFYVGNLTEKADSSQCRSGEKPKIIWHRNDYNNRLVERIVNYKKNNPNKTVGIIVANKRSKKPVKLLYSEIANYVKLNKLENTIRVQHYLSGSIQTLDFDSPNTITVLTKQSCKGLEFDCVFVPRINSLDFDDQGFAYSRDLYVVFHRARDQLFITVGLSDEDEKNEVFQIPPILKTHLRTKDYKGEFINVGFSDQEELLNFVDTDHSLDREQKTHAQKILDARKSKEREKILNEERTESEPASESATLKKNESINYKIYDEAYIFIDEKKWTKKNDLLLRDNISSLPHGDQNLLLARWARKKTKKSSIRETNKKTKKKIEPTKVELDLVTGMDGNYSRILDIVKESLISENGMTLQIISAKKNTKKVFKKIASFLTRNKAGISNQIAPNVSTNTIQFVHKGENKIIKIISPDGDIDWFEKIAILGLEDIKVEDISEQLEELLGNIFLKPAHNISIIHPNTDNETPGVKYIRNKNADGILTTYYEY